MCTFVFRKNQFQWFHASSNMSEQRRRDAIYSVSETTMPHYTSVCQFLLAISAIFFLTLLMPQTMSAQQTDLSRVTIYNQSQTYKISYVDERKLFQKGDVVTLAALKLEWPERISGAGVAELQNWLCSTLFNNECNTLAQGKKQFYESLGKEIDAMPDNPNIKRKYITIVLTEMAWEKDRYLSFRMAAIHRDGDTPVPTSKVDRLITFDVVAEKILTLKDIIKGSYLPGKIFHTDLVSLITSHLPERYEERLTQIILQDNKKRYDLDKTLKEFNLTEQVCLLGKSRGIAFNLKQIPDEEGLDMFVQIPRYNYLDNFLTTKAIKLLDREGPTKKKAGKAQGRDKNMEKMDVMDDGQPIYLVVDSMPQFPGGVSEMTKFIMQQLKFPEEEILNSTLSSLISSRKTSGQGRVVVSFVVGVDGRIWHPSVILPLSPAFDRAAVKAVLDMKPWIPGKLNGNPVNVRMAIPLVFKL